MGYRASLSGCERPWERLMAAFLALIESHGARLSGDQVCELFFADSWFQEIVKLRTQRAVDRGCVPRGCREDLEQTLLLLFFRKTTISPDLRVSMDLVDEHFAGWIWTLVDNLCLQAIRRIRRDYRCERTLAEDVVSHSTGSLDRRVDVKLLIAEMPILTQTVLSRLDEGYKLREIANLLHEEYWKVCKLQRDAVAHLRKCLNA